MAIYGIAAGEFIVDQVTPLGVSDWVWYFIPLLLSAFVGRRYFPYLLAGLFSLLILAGYYLSPPGEDAHAALTGRLVGISALWVIALLLSHRKVTEEKIRRTERALKTISGCNQALVRATTEAALLQEICRTIVEKGGYRLAWVGFAENDENKSVRFGASAGGDEGYLEKSKITWADSERGRGPTGTAIRTGRIAICHDFQTDPAVAPWREEAGKRGYASSIVLPLTDGEKTFGVLSIYAAETHAFKMDEEVELLTELAADLAYGIQALRTRAEHERAEETIRQSEQNYREIFNATNEAIFLHDAATGRVLDVNDAMLQMYGCDSKAEALASKIEDFSANEPPYTWVEAQRFIRRAIEEGPQVFEWRARKKNGGHFWVEVSLRNSQIGAQKRILAVARDITERKRAEEVLRESETLLRESQVIAGLGSYVLDIPAGMWISSDVLDKVFGIDKTYDRSVAGWAALIHPQDRAMMTDYFTNEVLGQGQTFNKEYRIIRHDDRAERWVCGNGRLEFDAHGRPLKMRGTIQDITERKHAEKELRRLSLAVEQSPVSIVITDTAGNIEYVNPKFTEVSGYTFAEVRGKNPRILKASSAPPEFFRHLWQTISAGHEWHGEFLNRKKNGDTYWEAASISPFTGSDGQITGYVAIKDDITRDKLAEEKIRAQAELLNLAHDAISIRDPDDRILYWNRSAERIYGWTSAEAAGRTSRELLQLDPFKCSEAHRLLLLNGYWTGEFTAHAKDGRELLIESSWTLVRDGQNRPQSILAFSVDITERRKLEQQVARTQRIESLGTLASGVAHDLNNILTPIMVSVGLLKEQVQEPKLLRLLAGLDSSTQRGARLVKQILTFGRGVKGERIAFNLRDIAREIQHLVSETFPKSIQFELLAADNLWAVIGDPTQIHQVFLNLSINARDAMPNGGKLTFALENNVLGPVYAGLNPEAKPGPHVLIQITDTGMGMSREVIERIFDPFFTTKPPGSGTGLGLSTSLGIIKSHGGFINVYSEPGQGSTFKIYLPAITNGDQTEKQTVTQTGLPQGRNELILLVDDEEAICTAVKKILERFGYRVMTAANGAEAISVYAAHGRDIAVVITDMHMPIMDGPATIIALQSMNPQVKIIGSSGLAANGGVAKAASSGVRHFVPKPYTAEKMLRTLRVVLDGAPEDDPDPGL